MRLGLAEAPAAVVLRVSLNGHDFTNQSVWWTPRAELEVLSVSPTSGPAEGNTSVQLTVDGIDESQPAPPEPPPQTRKRRLSFNEDVLVASYIKGSSGISPARELVPLVEMEKRAKQRAEEQV